MTTPSINQDLKTYAGNVAVFNLIAIDADGEVLDLTGVQQITWQLARDLETPVLVEKTCGAGVTTPTPAEGTIQVTLGPADTGPLDAYYIHQAVIEDVDGNIFTVVVGRVQVGRAPIWTYSGDPTVSARDYVRFLINDTVESNPQAMDAELDALLGTYVNPYRAAAAACRQLAAKYMTKVNKRVGDLSINYSDIAKGYQLLAKSLEAQGNTMGLQPYSGGISKTDKRQIASNQDRVRPPFRYKQFDNRSGPNGGDGAWNDGFGDGS